MRSPEAGRSPGLALRRASEGSADSDAAALSPDKSKLPSVSISFEQAERCEFGRPLLDLISGNGPGGEDDGTEDPADSGDGSFMLPIPAWPSSVDTEGLAMLECWARFEAASLLESPGTSAEQHGATGEACIPSSSSGSSSGSSLASRRRQWVPEFARAYADRLHLALHPAEFLGCDGFLELYLQLQLLRVAMADGAALEQLARRGSGAEESIGSKEAGSSTTGASSKGGSRARMLAFGTGCYPRSRSRTFFPS